MTLLDTIQSLSAGPLGWASLIGAIGFAVKQGSAALKTRSEAQSKRLVAEAEAARVRAETERTETETTAAMLSRYETRLTETEGEVRAARAEVAQARADAAAAAERVEELLAEVDLLRRAMRKAGIPTPPRGFAAATRTEGFTAPDAAPTDNPDPQKRGPHR